MTKWIAKFNEGDDYYGEEVMVAIAGSEYGYEVILSNGDDSDVFPGVTEEETLENLEDTYGYYETFQWLTEE